MKIRKTATIFLTIGVTLILLSVLAFFIPYEQILPKLPYVKDLYNNTTLTITSKNGKAEIFINDTSYGQTPNSIKDLAPGKYKIRLSRISDNKDAYSDRFFEVELVNGTEAVVDAEIAPSDVNNGYVMYFTQSPQTGSNKGYLTINTPGLDTSVSLDGEFLNKTPINAQTLQAKQYEVKIMKNGYETLTIPVIVRADYNLNITAYLMPIPIQINEESE